MAREYARLRLDMWITGDIRKLSPRAQHLYFVLLTSPDLSYCGVADWRPGRIAAIARGWTADQVRGAADELAQGRYVVTDEETEEVLVRSFVRNDGLMKESRVAVSMVKAFGSVASTTLRGVIVYELRRLHAEQPDLKGWRTTSGEPGQALALLELEPIDPAALRVGLVDGLAHPLGVGLAQTPPGVSGSVTGSPSPAPTPAPSPSTDVEGARAPRAHRLPDDFSIDDELRRWAVERGFNDAQVDEMTGSFVRHWQSKSGRDAAKLDWRKAWQNWVARENPRSVRVPATASTGTRPAWEL